MKRIANIITKIKDELATLIIECANDILRKFEKIEKSNDNQCNKIKYKLVYCNIFPSNDLPYYIYSQRHFQMNDNIIMKIGKMNKLYKVSDIYYDHSSNVIVLLVTNNGGFGLKENFVLDYNRCYERSFREYITNHYCDASRNADVLNIFKQNHSVILSDDTELLELIENYVKDYIRL